MLRPSAISAILVLLAGCVPEPPQPTGAESAGAGPSEGAGPSGMPAPLVLPEATPFSARTRVTPVTIVDERGAPKLVLDALGVRVEVDRVLADRALVRCTGCRAEVAGWIQRSAVLPRTPDPDESPFATDALLHWMDTQSEAHPSLENGVVPGGTGWIAPPWHAEGGTAGAVVQIAPRTDGGGWSLVASPGADEAPPEDGAPDEAPEDAGGDE